MKTFTFYEHRRYTHVERCSFSVYAETYEEAKIKMLDAINDGEDMYSNYDYEPYEYNVEDTLFEYYDENGKQIY